MIKVDRHGTAHIYNNLKIEGLRKNKKNTGKDSFFLCRDSNQASWNLNRAITVQEFIPSNYYTPGEEQAIKLHDRHLLVLLTAACLLFDSQHG
jgi:hypothetical protein